MTNRNAFLAGFALIGALAGSGADAHISLSDENVHQKRVSYSDLDLTVSDDAKTLMYRLQRAADEVCGRWDGSADQVSGTRQHASNSDGTYCPRRVESNVRNFHT